jgi:hypothetical protein
MEAVLRVWGSPFDVKAFLEEHPQIVIESVWREGELGPLKRARKNSGFNCLVAEHDEWPEVLRLALAHLEGIAPVLHDASRAGAKLEVDFAIDAGAGDEAYGSAWFSPMALRSLSDLGVELRITAYPVCPDQE